METIFHKVVLCKTSRKHNAITFSIKSSNDIFDPSLQKSRQSRDQKLSVYMGVIDYRDTHFLRGTICLESNKCRMNIVHNINVFIFKYSFKARYTSIGQTYILRSQRKDARKLIYLGIIKILFSGCINKFRCTPYDMMSSLSKSSSKSLCRNKWTTERGIYRITNYSDIEFFSHAVCIYIAFEITKEINIFIYMKEKYLFLYLKTWWWHISAAKAIERSFSKNLDKDIEIVLADGLEETNKIIKSIIVDGYATAQKEYAQSAFEVIYLCNKCYPVAKAHQILLSFFTKEYIKKVITKEKPNKIVIFHFFLVMPVLETLKELWMKIPVITIVTDPFTCPRTWFMEKNMNYIVYSERVKQYARNLWVKAKNIKIFPPIIHEKFLNRVSPQEVHTIKNNFHIPLHKKVILLLWWGDGLPKGKEILKELVSSKIKAHIIMVCGKDKRLLRQVQKIKKENPDTWIQVHGFVDFTQDLIHLSDIVISKWWPATIFEILLCGKIPLVHNYMREQEKWNIEFILDNKVWRYEKDIKKLIKIVKEMLEGDMIPNYQHAIQKLNLKIWTNEIAEYIKNFQLQP